MYIKTVPTLDKPVLREITRVGVLILFLIGLFVPVLRLMQNAKALSDTTPMELIDFALVNNSADVSEGFGYIELSGQYYEDLSGFEGVYYQVKSPSGQQIIEGDANGDPEFLSETITFPQYAEAGVWELTLTLIDQAGNINVITPEDFVSMNYDAEITIISDTPDTTTPTLSSVSFDTSTVDTATGEDLLTVTITADDDLSGFSNDSSFTQFVSSSGQRVGGGFTPIGGNTYQSVVPFRQYSEVGDWSLEITLADQVGNTRFFESTELEGNSWPATVSVTGNGDTTPITINDIYFSAEYPPTGDVFGSIAKVTLYVDIADNLSGIGSFNIWYESQTTTQVANSTYYFDGTYYQYTVFLPSYGAEGEWLPHIESSDQVGNHVSYSYTDLVNLGYDLALNLGTTESAEVESGGSVTTDTGNTGATPSNPFQASVQTPVAGTVSVTPVSLTEPESANDYFLFNQQFNIEAPIASAEDPLVLTFTVDSDSLGGQTANDIVILRNGDLLEDCESDVFADPDPCIAERNTLQSGDVEIVVWTSEASTWFIGVQPNQETYQFQKFKKPVRGTPYLNEVKAGSVLPVKFKLGGDFGLNVLPEYVATSQRIKCDTKQPVGEPTEINLTAGGALKFNANNNVYKFNWKTQKKWDDSCRQLILNFSNGETITANFEFDD